MTRYSAPPYVNRHSVVSTTQPQILPNIIKYSSISRNLLFYSSLHSRNLIDVVSGNLGTIIGNPSYSTGPFGILPILTSSTNISFPLVRNLDGNKPTTIMWQQKPINTSGYSCILNILPSINGTNSYLIYASASDTAYGFTVGLRNNTSSVANFQGPIPLLSNDSLDTYVLTLAAGMNDTSSTLSNIVLWKNGVRVLPNRFSIFSSDSTPVFKIGVTANGTTDPFEGIIGSVGIWQRILTDSECRQLSINTFSLLEPASKPILNILDTIHPITTRESRILPTSGPTRATAAPFVLRAPKIGFGGHNVRLGRPVTGVVAAMHTGNALGMVEMVSNISTEPGYNIGSIRTRGPILSSPSRYTQNLNYVGNRSDFIVFGISLMYSTSSAGGGHVNLLSSNGYGWKAGVEFQSGTPAIGIGGYWSGTLSNCVLSAFTYLDVQIPIHWAIAVNTTAGIADYFINGRQVGNSPSIGLLDPVAIDTQNRLIPYDPYSSTNANTTVGVASGCNTELAKHISKNVYAMFNPAKSDDRWASI